MQPVYSIRSDQCSTALGAANLACAWLVMCGFGVEVWRQLGCAHVSASSNPGLLAAALDLMAVLDSTPDGRQAVADLS